MEGGGLLEMMMEEGEVEAKKNTEHIVLERVYLFDVACMLISAKSFSFLYQNTIFLFLMSILQNKILKMRYMSINDLYPHSLPTVTLSMSYHTYIHHGIVSAWLVFMHYRKTVIF